MPEPTAALASALNRLSAALDGLDTAVLRRRTRDEASGSRDAELSLMQEDRARLAEELDQALHRLNRLDAASADAMQRIDRAMGAVQSALGALPEER